MMGPNLEITRTIAAAHKENRRLDAKPKTLKFSLFFYLFFNKFNSILPHRLSGPGELYNLYNKNIIILPGSYSLKSSLYQKQPMGKKTPTTSFPLKFWPMFPNSNNFRD